MIITRAPLRISFFGGGTDYPEFFLEEGGAVLATAQQKAALDPVPCKEAWNPQRQLANSF